MERLEYDRNYLDYLLCLFKGDFESYLEHVEEIFIRLRNVNLKLNVRKLSFGKNEIVYLDCVVTREGIKPQQQK